MKRKCTVLGWLLGLLMLAGADAGLAAPSLSNAGIAVASLMGASVWVPLAERLPGRPATEVDSIAANQPPYPRVDRIGFGLTSRYPAQGALPGSQRSVPCATAVYSRVFFPGLGWTAAIGYGRRSGNPGDDPTFVQPNGERVELVPLELGLRLGPERPGRFAWRVEISALAMWLRWTEPLPYRTQPEFGVPGGTRNEDQAWAAGGRIATGPEIQLPWHRLWLSADVGLEVMGTDHDGDGWAGGGGLRSWRLTLGRER